MPAYARPMRREDISQVIEIDREAFPTEWPPPSFKHELENRLAHYIVACDSDKTVDNLKLEAPPDRGFAALLSWVKRWFGKKILPDNKHQTADNHYIIGFAGFWVMADEAHITTIASRKEYRRQGVGELLLMSIIEMARKLKARIVTLEVRVSNIAAQTLYSKYGFAQVGVRRGYYMDNKEDGLLMSTEDISSAQFQELIKKLKEAYTSERGRVPDRCGNHINSIPQ
jgi:ribosomal-protein-alanine N-acetyltransferase